jgi:acetolactate synthase I/II/III large subunit
MKLTPPRTAAQHLVDQLVLQGVKRAFCVPGESYLAVLDALYDAREQIDLIVCRHEAGAGNMAEAYGKLTGQPGVVFVTRGPGATHASVAVHTAFQDSTPLVLFIGQVGTDFVEREAFQEIDYRRMFGQMAKWVASLDRADRFPELVARAFQVACSGRPGPVVLALPEDILTQITQAAPALVHRPAQAEVSQQSMMQLQSRLKHAKRPLMLVGGSRWQQSDVDALEAFSARSGMPVACAFRYQDHFSNTHPHYVGDVGIGANPKLTARVQASDLLIVVGARLGEMTTNGYSLLEAPQPTQQLVHVYPGAEELGRVYQAEQMIVSSAPAFIASIAALDLSGCDTPAWTTHALAGHKDYLSWLVPRAQPGALNYPQIIRDLVASLPLDTVLTNGAGNFAAPLHRFYQHQRLHTQLAPTSGAMGYSVPAAVSAKLEHPERMAIAFAGDGEFLMCGQEMATAAQYHAPITVLVVNNGMFGTIRMHQEKNYPERVYGTSIVNPDFVMMGKAYGAWSERVETTAQFAPAFERAVAANLRGQSALLELMIDPSAITPNATIEELRTQARKSLGG